MEGTLLWSKF